MKTEIEAKFLEIDPIQLREQLKSIGAKLIHPERLMRRRNFDYSDRRLQKRNGWVRVRDEGNKVTLSYKQLDDRTLHGTKEVNVQVENFDATTDFLQAIGLDFYSYQETKREDWLIEGVEVSIDTWPWIPTFVELEAPSEGQLRLVAKKLSLKWADATHGSVETAYQTYYDVSEDEIDNWSEIVFIPVPEWLSKHRKARG